MKNGNVIARIPVSSTINFASISDRFPAGIGNQGLLIESKSESII